MQSCDDCLGEKLKIGREGVIKYGQVVEILHRVVRKTTEKVTETIFVKSPTEVRKQITEGRTL